MSDWQRIESAPESKVVETKIDDENGVRNEQRLKRLGSLWFCPDASMYVCLLQANTLAPGRCPKARVSHRPPDGPPRS